MPSADARAMWKTAGRFSTLGLEMVASLTLALLAGQWLDERFQTEPYMTWVGAVVGFGAAINAVVRAIRIYRRPSKNEGHNETKS